MVGPEEHSSSINQDGLAIGFEFAGDQAQLISDAVSDRIHRITEYALSQLLSGLSSFSVSFSC
jgi:hypothetical protein